MLRFAIYFAIFIGHYVRVVFIRKKVIEKKETKNEQNVWEHTFFLRNWESDRCEDVNK